MPASKLQPEPALLLRVETAFIEHGYGMSSLRELAEACELPRDALDDYFNDKHEAFRAVVRYRNEVGLSHGLEAARELKARGGNVVDMFGQMMNVRFGDHRRVVNVTRHLPELNAEAHKRCHDIMAAVAVAFQAEIVKLLVECEAAGLLRLRSYVSPERVAQALADGARGVNQRLPPIAPEGLPARYREMCGFVLFGCADLPAMSAPPRERRGRKAKAKTESAPD
jgi:AcrR family transcriptional regulator